MGTRYFIPVKCPGCGETDEAYYAPTCGIVDWVCVNCEHTIDLEKYTGISYEDASNRSIIEDLLNDKT